MILPFKSISQISIYIFKGGDMLRDKIALWSKTREEEVEDGGKVPGEEVVSMQAAAVEPPG